jgi:hypothetical protein
VGDIDLVWGKEGASKSDGFGLSKIAKFHPEALDDLQGHLDGMRVVSRSDNRVRLESPTHRAMISLDYYGQRKVRLRGITSGHPIRSRIPTFLNPHDQLGVTKWETLSSKSYAKGYAFGAYLMRNLGGAQLLKDIL